jgi:hypothetical protein
MLVNYKSPIVKRACAWGVLIRMGCPNLHASNAIDVSTVFDHAKLTINQAFKLKD